MTSLAVKIRTAAAMTEISETTIREAINKQELPAFRVGREIRVKIADLEAWIDSLQRVGVDQ